MTHCLAHYTRLLRDATDADERFVYHLVLEATRLYQRVPTHAELHQYWREWYAPNRVHPWIVLSNRPLMGA